jgi:hypothetical protein
MAKSVEELYIGKIESGIRSIKLGTKNPNETQVGMWLGKLKPINIGMHDELFDKYKKVMVEYEKKHSKVFG